MKKLSIINNIYVKLFIAAFFWGGSSIAAKILMKSASPSVATFSRFCGAAIILFFIVRLPSGKSKISLHDHLKLIILGLVGITLCYYLYFCGLQLSSTFNAALFEATTPLLTFLISLLIRKEKFDIYQFIGLIVAYFGIIVITMQGDFVNLINMNFNYGDILLLLSTVCFGLYNVFYKNFSIKISASLKTYYIFLYGGIGLLPWLVYDIYTKKGLQITLSFSSIFCILFLAAGSSVISYLFFNEGITKLGASKASECINLVPIIAIILTLIVLKDIPKWYQIIGAIIILVGMFISKRK